MYEYDLEKVEEDLRDRVGTVNDGGDTAERDTDTDFTAGTTGRAATRGTKELNRAPAMMANIAEAFMVDRIVQWVRQAN